ncbi:MAG: class I SAM-dependent methyltransferase [Planctomycetota bacterium]
MNAATEPAADPAALRPVTPNAILAARLAAVTARISGAGAASPEDLAELERCVALSRDLDPYLERTATPASPALEALQRATVLEDWVGRFEDGATAAELEAEMLSGHVEGQFLRMLVRISGATDVLEIGMFTGYATLAMAEALPAGGRVLACELDPFAARVASEQFSKHAAGERIEIAIEPASDTLERLVQEGRSFDLVFIDADKKGYAAYYDALLDGGLVPVGGLVCVDNTLYQGQVYAAGLETTPNGRALADFNANVAADERVEQVILPLRDGLTLIERVR